MNPDTNQPQLNNEPSFMQPAPTQELIQPQQPKNNSKWIIISVIIILILGGGYFAYTKFMPAIITNQPLDENMPTAIEKEQVKLSFIEIKNLYASKDIAGLRQYFADQGNTEDDIREIMSIDKETALKEIEIKNMMFLSHLSVDQILANKDIKWFKGSYEDNSPYIEVSIPTKNPLGKGNGIMTYTFSYEMNKWYWTETLFSPKNDTLSDLKNMTVDDYNKALSSQLPKEFITENNKLKTNIGPAIIGFQEFSTNNTIKLYVYLTDIPNIDSDLSNVTVIINHVYTKNGIDVLDKDSAFSVEKDLNYTTIHLMSSGIDNPNEKEPYFKAYRSVSVQENSITENTLKSIEGSIIITLPTSNGEMFKKSYPFILK